MFVPDDVNVFVKVVAIFGVVNRVPSTKLAHNVFLLRSCAYLNSLDKFGLQTYIGLQK